MLSSILAELEERLQLKKAPVLNNFNPGLPEKEIRDQLKAIRIENELLVELFSWKNGVGSDDLAVGEYEMFSFGTMISLKAAIDHYEAAMADNIWDKSLFPIFIGTDYILFDTSKGENGKIWYYAPSLLLSGKPVTIYDSLVRMLGTIIECYRFNAFNFTETGELEIDYDLEEQISEQLNPKSRYWSQKTGPYL